MNRLRITFTGLLLLAGFFTLLNGVVPAQDESPDKKKVPPRYMGAKGCKKCHMKSSIGRQFKVWQSMKHAKAIEALKSDQALEVAKKIGLKNKPSEDPKCLKCHTTAYGLPKTHYGEKFSLEEGVTCEACHGAGEFFDKPEDGKLHKEAHGKGYITPDEKLCRTCHNEESPTWDPKRYTTKDGKKVGFDYQSGLKKVNHLIPKKDKKEGGK